MLTLSSGWWLFEAAYIVFVLKFIYEKKRRLVAVNEETLVNFFFTICGAVILGRIQVINGEKNSLEKRKIGSNL